MCVEPHGAGMLSTGLQQQLPVAALIQFAHFQLTHLFQKHSESKMERKKFKKSLHLQKLISCGKIKMQICRRYVSLKVDFSGDKFVHQAVIQILIRENDVIYFAA